MSLTALRTEEVDLKESKIIPFESYIKTTSSGKLQKDAVLPEFERLAEKSASFEEFVEKVADKFFGTGTESYELSLDGAYFKWMVIISAYMFKETGKLKGITWEKIEEKFFEMNIPFNSYKMVPYFKKKLNTAMEDMGYNAKGGIIVIKILSQYVKVLNIEETLETKNLQVLKKKRIKEISVKMKVLEFEQFAEKSSSFEDFVGNISKEMFNLKGNSQVIFERIALLSGKIWKKDGKTEKVKLSNIDADDFCYEETNIVYLRQIIHSKMLEYGYEATMFTVIKLLSKYSTYSFK